MDGIEADIMRWLEHAEGPWGYGAVGLASLIEYLVPPVPGDTIAVFGVFLAATAGWSALGVYLALNLGAIAGGMGAYAFGRSLARKESRPRFMQGPRIEAGIAAITAKYAQHGAIYLAANRFVPAMRAFFFVGAGIARLPWWSVLLWGGVSALAWNGILLGLGWWVGSEWERLRSIVSTYSTVVIAIVIVVAAIVAVRAWRRRSAASPPPPAARERD